jgi:hypothetical protein
VQLQQAHADYRGLLMLLEVSPEQQMESLKLTSPERREEMRNQMSNLLQHLDRLEGQPERRMLDLDLGRTEAQQKRWSGFQLLERNLQQLDRDQMQR